jgi:hypothetical protein
VQSENQSQTPRTISRIDFRGLPEQLRTELLAKMPIQKGAKLSAELLQEALRVAKSFDQRLDIQVNEAPSSPNVPPQFKDTVAVIVYDPAAVWPQRIKLQASALDAMAIEKVTPVCPRQLLDAPRTGVVQLAVIVAKDGTVKEVDPLTGPESLVEPAIDAVRRWKYRAVLLNGLPVEVQTTVDVSFA